MKTLKTRLTKWAGLLRNTWAKVGADGNDVFQDIAYMLAIPVLGVPAFVAVVVFGK